MNSRSDKSQILGFVSSFYSKSDQISSRVKTSTTVTASVLLLIILASIGHGFQGAAALAQNGEQQSEAFKQQERMQQSHEIQKHMENMLQQLPELIAQQIQHDIQNQYQNHIQNQTENHPQKKQ